MTPEQEQIVSHVGTALGTIVTVIGGPAAVRAGLRWWAGFWERRARARENREAAKAKAEVHTIHELWDLVNDLRERVDRVEDENRKLRDEVTKLRDENRDLRSRLRRYEQRSTTPPGAYAVHSSRADMEPKEE